jgi:hypothetical protein
MTSPRLSVRARFDFAAYGAQLLAPPLILGATIGAVGTGRVGTAVALVATYLAAGGTLAFDALRWEAGPDGRPLPFTERLGRSGRAALFSAVWLLRDPGAMWRLATCRGHVRMTRCPTPARRARTRGRAMTGRAMTGRLRRVAVIFTGGTISMRVDPMAGGNVPALSGADILARTPGLDAIAAVEPIDLGRTPASHFTFDGLFEIADTIRSAQADPAIDGVVLVQGTDVIEETAFFWDLVLSGEVVGKEGRG